MHRPIYACDRCGHWYTTSVVFSHNELPFEPAASSRNGWDLCERCTDDYPPKDLDVEEWFHAGKGAEVKPRKALT